MSWTLDSLERSLLIGSTLVEGSTLSESEARQVLAGRTVQGHPVAEVRELLNYRSSVEWLMRQFARSPFLSRDLVLGFHERLFAGFPVERGRWKAQRNFTYLSDGSRFEYAPPSAVEGAMREWIESFNASSGGAEEAARLYHGFQRIHPFEDGNGRVGRILVAYWLHWKARLSFEFRLKDKTEHLAALECADTGDPAALVFFFKKRARGKGKKR